MYFFVGSLAPSGRQLLEDLLRHVEVAVDLVDVVVLFERVEEAQQVFGLAALDQDGVLRLHRHFRGLDLDSRLLQGLAHGPEIGAQLRSALPSESQACLGAFVGYAVELEHFGVRARAGGCESSFDNRTLSGSASVWDFELRLFRGWDLSRVSFGLGLGGGISLWNQHFATNGEAPSRQSAAPFLGLHASAGCELGAGFQLALDVAAETHFLRVQAAAWEAPQSTIGFALRPALRVGKYF